ncbi:MAG: alpha/beta fold hydrolase [Proteobacteria bacterium]|nr:alpha/beta fold hydrolase [Pseudomonadota bacterium]
MKRWSRLLIIGLAFVFGLGYLPPAMGQGLTIKPQYLVVKIFRLASGAVLKKMTIEYATLGRPQKDQSGNIINAVVSCHGYNGNYSQILMLKGMVGPGRAFDTNRFFIICPTALGSPGSSSPSTSGLGPKFPKFSVRDMVAAQYLLVTKHLKIKHLAGVFGASMGGLQTLEWITRYPGFMDWAIPIATSGAFDGRKAALVVNSTNAIKMDPAYKNGYYKQQPQQGMGLRAVMSFVWYFTPAYFKMKYKTTQSMVMALNMVAMGGARTMDANDVIWRNEALLKFDVRPKLKKVKARVLLIGVNTDEIIPPVDFIPTAKAIPGAKLFSYNSILGHLGCAFHLTKADQAIRAFLGK